MKKMKTKNYTSSPLPFQGQKRRFVKQFIKIITENPGNIYVDLFGGSGLLSQIAKTTHPDTRVIFNDFDNFHKRIKAIAQTNALLDDLRAINKDIAKDAKLNHVQRKRVPDRIKQEKGYVDYITLSSSLLFAMNYVKTFDELSKATLYNKIRQSSYNAEGYLSGVEVVHEDYRKVYDKYKNQPGVVFLIDPPYLSTDCTSYENYWRLKDYLDVMLCLYDSSYIYFTSNKSNIVELCEWIETNTGGVNPFSGATTHTMQVAPTYNASYTDVMICKYV